MNDPRHIGAYGITEAAQYLSLAPGTLQTWVRGRSYRSSGVKRFSEPLIQLPVPDESLLSFTNLVEAHVLKAIRRRHGLSMQQVRPALYYLEEKLGVPHPLARQELLTDGVHLFIEQVEHLVNVSKDGQLAMKELIEAHLRRVEHDEGGLAFRLFPFSRGDSLNVPRIVVVDPRISFGRPVIDGTSVRTETVASRLKAGESITDLADDYGVEVPEIEEAIRYELAA